jgi:hypothetical protein
VSRPARRPIDAAAVPLWGDRRRRFHRGRVRLDLDRTVAALRAADRLDDADRALIALARSTANGLDRLEADAHRSEHVVASMARVHLSVLMALAQRDASAGELSPGDQGDEELRELLREYGDPE